MIDPAPVAAAPVKALVLADVVLDAPEPEPEPTAPVPAAEPEDVTLALVAVATVVAIPPAAVVNEVPLPEAVTGARTLELPTLLPALGA